MTVPQSASFRILIVDDDPAMLRLITTILTREGTAIECAGTIAAALEKLAQPWDLVILDRSLPDGDGAVLCATAKSAPSPASVVLLTARATLEEKLEGFAYGADDYITKPFIPAELVARVDATRRTIALQKELLDTNEKLARANQTLAELAVTDMLTGLPNRRLFGNAFEMAFKQAIRYEDPLSLTLIDIDHFKEVNDRLGHAAGDDVLREVARRLGAIVRGADVLARFGGEEFVLLLPHTSLEEAIHAAEKMRIAVGSDPYRAENVYVNVTISIGAASIPYSSLGSPHEMLVAADAALYRAKNRGRNRVEAERRRNKRTTEAILTGHHVREV